MKFSCRILLPNLLNWSHDDNIKMNHLNLYKIVEVRYNLSKKFWIISSLVKILS